MPALTVHSLRLAFVWGAAGAVLGGFTLFGKALSSMSPAARQLHMDCMLYGWMMQLVFATAYWIFPRVNQERPRAGLAIVGIAAWNASLVAATCVLWLPVSSFAAALLRLTAALLLALHFFPRIRAAAEH